MRLLPYLKKELGQRDAEIIVVDGGSNDGTAELCVRHRVSFIQSDQKGRACQLTYGVEHAIGDILYFVHADVLPPLNFYEHITKAIANGHPCGCFSFQFDHPSRLLKLNARLTRIPSAGIGGGDQTLFVTRKAYDDVGGFNKSLCIMEDFDLAGKLRARFRFTIIKKDALVSARKYHHNSWLRVQFANAFILTAYKLGAPQLFLYKTYRQLIKHR